MRALLLTTLAIAPTLACAQVLHVQVDGAVAAPGARVLPADTRRAELLLEAAPRPDAYMVGAALLQTGNVLEQTRLKAGLLYDLQAIAQLDDPALSMAATALQAWLVGLPVSGRAVGVQLEPRRVELVEGANQKLQDGDRFVYPTRPDSIQVVGAVAQPCALPHVPQQDAARYLRDCPAGAGADPDTVFAIQPDGVVQTLGVAAWNRSNPQPLAPGAVLFVPLVQQRVSKIDPLFNAQVAQFLATQVLPAPGAGTP
ncbi:Capsule biosynthesis GfcC [Pseudoxanthomonas sp. GM95]|nr:Capsule biosynthesis GfcC [Pseudoxanthomonas sp. GM95]